MIELLSAREHINNRCKNSSSDDFTKQTATGIFVIVTMNVENIGKESATMSSTDVKIIDSEGEHLKATQKLGLL